MGCRLRGRTGWDTTEAMQQQQHISLKVFKYWEAVKLKTADINVPKF